MRRVIYHDERTGWLRAALVRDTDPDELAPKGIPQNPPDVSLISWEDVCRDINDDLVQQGVTTWADVQARQSALTSIIMSAIRKRLVMLFKTEEMLAKEQLKEAVGNE